MNKIPKSQAKLKFFEVWESNFVFLTYLGNPFSTLDIITSEPIKEKIGWIGYWELKLEHETSWEIGWSVLPEHQGKGFATAAIKQLLKKLSQERNYQYVYAHPSVENGPSNAICRKTGFEKIKEEEVEYPKGSMMKSSVWRKELKKVEEELKEFFFCQKFMFF
jgi:RimJ/RimL family protein N-acetyltransferase